jgi:SulP family sulfate permease
MTVFLQIFKAIPALFIPAILRSGFTYTRSDFRADCIAGLTVTAVLVPQTMALALIAGLPAVYGLYAALPGCIAALWGSSRHLSTGPVAIVSFLVLSSLIPLAAPGTTDFIVLAAALALLVGTIQLLLGMLRMGFLMHLIPHSAIAGFSTAAALIIAITQVPQLFGFTTTQHEFVFQNIFEIVTHIGKAELVSSVLGIAALAFLFLARRFPPVFPATLVLIGVSIGLTYAFDLARYGVALVGAIPALLPALTIPTIGAAAFFSLIPKAAIIALVGFIEAYAIAHSVAQKTRQSLDTNQELVGQGLANIAAGVFQGYPTSGSFMRTAVNVRAGARTSIAAVVTSLATIGVLLFLSPILALLPTSVLAAIVIAAAISLVNFEKLRQMHAVFHIDGIVAYVTFIMAFALKPDDAIFIGIVLALVLFIRQTVWGVRVSEMVIDEELTVLRPKHEHGDGARLPGVLIIRPGMSLYYANAVYITEQLEKIVAQRMSDTATRLRFVVIDCSGINFVDVTGMEVFGDSIKRIEEKYSPTIILMYLRRTLRDTLRNTSSFPNIGIVNNIAQLRKLNENTLTEQLRTES